VVEKEMRIRPEPDLAAARQANTNSITASWLGRLPCVFTRRRNPALIRSSAFVVRTAITAGHRSRHFFVKPAAVIRSCR
jgi:hypothetical protein